MTTRSRLNSFGYAFKGLLFLIRQEPNMLIHLLVAIVVVITGILKHLGKGQWIAIAFAIGIVWICEAFNTAVELLCDLYSKEYNNTIKMIKDISAAAVLVSSLTAAAVGIIIFFF
jgi:diacylglycerol kinase